MEHLYFLFAYTFVQDEEFITIHLILITRD